MTKVVHITTVHAWDDTRISRKQCAGLAKNGYTVRLVAPQSQTAAPDETWILPIPRFNSRMLRMSLGSFAAIRRALAEKADLYHFHDPELIGVGLALKALGKRVVYDVHENVSQQILSKYWIPRPLRTLVSLGVRGAEWIAGRTFDGIVGVTEEITSRFPGQKSVTVQNFPIIGELAQSTTARIAQRVPCVAYVGAMAVIRGPRELIEAVHLVSQRREVRLLIAGTFRPAQLEQELRHHAGWKHVDYRGWCDRPAVGRLLSESRVGVVGFLPEPNHIASQPNKLFEYMSAGLPVVASDFPRWREIVGGNECGLLVDPTKPQEIAEAIEWLLDHPEEAEQMGQRGRLAIEERLNWDSQLQILLDFYERLLKSSNDFRPAIGRQQTGIAQVHRKLPE